MKQANQAAGSRAEAEQGGGSGEAARAERGTKKSKVQKRRASADEEPIVIAPLADDASEQLAALSKNLPTPWTALFDKSSGVVYYANLATKVSIFRSWLPLLGPLAGRLRTSSGHRAGVEVTCGIWHPDPFTLHRLYNHSTIAMRPNQRLGLHQAHVVHQLVCFLKLFIGDADANCPPGEVRLST